MELPGEQPQVDLTKIRPLKLETTTAAKLRFGTVLVQMLEEPGAPFPDHRNEFDVHPRIRICFAVRPQGQRLFLLATGGSFAPNMKGNEILRALNVLQITNSLIEISGLRGDRWTIVPSPFPHLLMYSHAIALQKT